MEPVTIVLYALAGAFGGLVRMIVTGKSIVPLPRIEERAGSKFLNLGLIGPLIIGAFVGYILPHTIGVDGSVATLAGYGGSDLAENLVEREIQRRL